MENDEDLILFDHQGRRSQQPIERRLLVPAWEDTWSSATQQQRSNRNSRHLQSLGDDSSFLDAILGSILVEPQPSTEIVVSPSAPPFEPDESTWSDNDDDIRRPQLTSTPVTKVDAAVGTADWDDDEVAVQFRRARSSPPISPVNSVDSSPSSSLLSLNLVGRSPVTRRWERRTLSCASAPSPYLDLPRRPRSASPSARSFADCRDDGDSFCTHVVERLKEVARRGGEEYEERPTRNVDNANSGMSDSGAAGPSPPLQPPPPLISVVNASISGDNNSSSSSTSHIPCWMRHSMRCATRFRLADPPRPPPSPPPQTPSASQEEEVEGACDMAGESLSPIGPWPHNLSSMLACLACTLGIFNISRFAILSVQFGSNFIIQFFIMSLVLGIPLFTFHVSLGQLLGSGSMDMWKISPIFQGIGIALIISQALIGIYSIVGVSWLLVYFRDSFITAQDAYRWAEPFPGLLDGPQWRYNATLKLEETVGDYFAGVVLQRHNLEVPAHSAGNLKFQVTFNLAVVWMIVFIALSKGLRSYGKVVFLFSLGPAFGMLVLCTKLLGLTPSQSRGNAGFLQTDWSEFFLNSKSWSAAISEAFYTWGLLGASAMQMASHNRPKHLLHRDTGFVTIITFSILILAAFLANTCTQVLLSNGYLYIPSSYEKMSTYSFLHPLKNLSPNYYSTTPVRWMPHCLHVLGERTLRPGVNPRQQSGYQALRLATELVPATMAIIGADRLSPFWSVLFYFVLIMFGIAQQLAIMHCVITGIMAIKVKTMKNWETTITFFTCLCGFILGLPMATELGIFVVYFLDYCIGGSWWIMLLYLAELVAVFMVRGRPYSGETIVATLFAKAGSWLKNWAGPMLCFTWNVILPVVLMVICITVFKGGNYRDLYKWSSPMMYDYWPTWSRPLGSFIQLTPILTIPFVALVQSFRYLSKGPPDIFDRIQLLYRPPEESVISNNQPDITHPDLEATSAAIASITVVEDPPPKYTPPPSYTTATGARIAKMLRQSFRRSMRRITQVLGTSEANNNVENADNQQLEGLPPPPDYATVLVEINRRLSSSRDVNSIEPSAPTTSSPLSMSEVTTILRNSFRRAIRDNLVESTSSQRLVDSAVPISRDSIIPNLTDPDKSVESVN